MNRNDLRDFAQSILRLDDERMMWWEEKKRVESERDQARAELADVAAQRDAHLSRSVERDAHLSRSVELATKLREAHDWVDKLTSEMRAAKLAAVTPAVDEVDGFRVGDLVRNLLSAPDLTWGTVKHLGHYDRYVDVEYPRAPLLIAYSTLDLTRKPVEVGDTVRHRAFPDTGKVEGMDSTIVCSVRFADGRLTWWLLRNCIAIDPTVKP